MLVRSAEGFGSDWRDGALRKRRDGPGRSGRIANRNRRAANAGKWERFHGFAITCRGRAGGTRPTRALGCLLASRTGAF